MKLILSVCQKDKKMPNKLWTSKETAEYLGVSLKSLYQMVYRGTIPCIKINRNSLRFDPEEIAKMIENGRREAFGLSSR